MNGAAHGAEAVRSIVVRARELYEFQDFSFAGDYGDNGFLEDHPAAVQGEPLGVVVVVKRNAAGKAQHVVVLHRPRSSLLLFSRLMHEKFAGTPMPSTSSLASPETGVHTTVGTQWHTTARVSTPVGSCGFFSAP